MKHHICHITISDATHERRINNQLKLLKEHNISSSMFALFREGIPKMDKIYETPVIRIPVRFPMGGKWKFIEFNWKLFFRLLKIKTDVYHVHDLWPMPAVIMAAFIKKVPIIYDAHEYYRGLEIFHHKKKEKIIWSFVEKIALYFTSALITVSEPLRKLYLKTYPNLKKENSFVVRNVPSLEDSIPQNVQLKMDLQKGDWIVFQGIFKPGRGLPQLIRAMKYVQRGKLLLVGYGEIENELRDLVKKENLSEKVVFYGRAGQEELLSITRKGKVGVVLFEPTSLNYKFALPNKFFEYVHAGIPILASRIPTFQAIYRKYPFGEMTNPFDHLEISQKINKLLLDKSAYKKYQRNINKMKKIFNWEKEKKRLWSIYTIFFIKFF